MKYGGWTLLLPSALAHPGFAALCGMVTSEPPVGFIAVVSSAGTEVGSFDYLGKRYFLKEYLFVNWKKHLSVLRRGQKLAKIASQLEDRGFLTPRVVGIGRSGKRRRVVTEAVENARDVWDVLFPERDGERAHALKGFLLSFGRTVGRLHHRGFFHGDLRWRNVLAVTEHGEWNFYFIDNDRTARYRFGIPFRCRVKNLSQVLFSGLLVGWPWSEWEVFLRGYFETSGLEASMQGKLTERVEARAQKRLADRNNRGFEKS